MQVTSGFWNTTHKRQIERVGDPLGFDALREAMADCLLPHISGSTSHADDYLWILVGLRWARDQADTPVDAEIWGSFRLFERALKQYWQKFKLRADYLGKNRVKKLCVLARPDVNQSILVNERATGLLGTYIASLRAIGLVENSRLEPTKCGDELVRSVKFNASSRTFTNWLALHDGFHPANGELKTLRRALGAYLFRDGPMRSAAAARIALPNADCWEDMAKRLDLEQQRVASACSTLLDVEKAMVQAFCELTTGHAKLSVQERASVRSTSARAIVRQPIPVAWLTRPLGQAINAAWIGCQDGHNIEQHLVDLHVTVSRSIRGNEPWITELGETSSIEYTPTFSGRDFRFKTLSRLVQETKWSPT